MLIIHRTRLNLVPVGEAGRLREVNNITYLLRNLKYGGLCHLCCIFCAQVPIWKSCRWMYFILNQLCTISVKLLFVTLNYKVWSILLNHMNIYHHFSTECYSIWPLNFSHFLIEKFVGLKLKNKTNYWTAVFQLCIWLMIL